MNIDKQLNELSEIRNLMEKSSKFLSLSGLSGVFAGLFALIGAAIVYFKYSSIYNNRFEIFNDYTQGDAYLITNIPEFIKFTILLGTVVFILALGSGLFFTIRKAKRHGTLIWDSTSKRLFVNLFIPIIAGGIFIIALFYHHLYFLVAPTTLIFYGLGLLNASKFTLREIKYLGISEIALGLLSAFFIGYGLVFWAFGFGILHIVYGIGMYLKYER